jgi:hypothetical protein
MKDQRSINSIISCFIPAIVFLFLASSATAQQVISSGECVLNDSIDDIGAMRAFAFDADLGTGVLVSVWSADGQLDPFVELYSPDNERLDSAWNPAFRRPEIHIPDLPEQGRYRIQVSGYGGTTGSFNLCLLTMPGATSRGVIGFTRCQSGTIDHDMDSFSFYGLAGDGMVATLVAARPDYFSSTPQAEVSNRLRAELLTLMRVAGTNS